MNTSSNEGEEISSRLILNSFLPVSVCIMAVLSYVECRRRVFPIEQRFPCLQTRFGVVVPLDFMGGLRERWWNAFAFGLVAPSMVDLLTEENTLLFIAPSYLKALAYLLAAFQVAVVFLPLFACLSTHHQLLGGILGFLYTLAWFIVSLYNFLQLSFGSCKKQDFEMDVERFLQCHSWLYKLPTFLWIVLLLLRFGFLVVTSIRFRQRGNTQKEESDLLQSHQYQYVQTLLRPPGRPVEKSWFQRRVYEWDPYFKFPSRMISVAVVSLNILYLYILTQELLAYFAINWLYQNITGPFWLKYLNYLTYCRYVALVVSVLLSVSYMVHVLVCYRKHMKRLRAGNKSFLPVKYHTPSSDSSVAALARCPGYQVAFTVWGFTLVQTLLSVCAIVFVLVVVDPILNLGFVQWLRDAITFLANFIIVLVIVKVQVLLARFFFLQDKISPEDKQKPLALNNRKVFHNFSFFFFFYNMPLGLGSCLFRVVRSLLAGTMLVSRIDRTIMPRGYELLDVGYRTWVGMIMSDHYHSNPILVCFCHLLIKLTVERETKTRSYSPLNSTAECRLEARIHARWLLLYTLLRNPKLILLRKRSNPSPNRDELAFAWALASRENTTTTTNTSTTSPKTPDLELDMQLL